MELKAAASQQVMMRGRHLLRDQNTMQNVLKTKGKEKLNYRYIIGYEYRKEKNIKNP
jgi:hypothetical protein